VIYIATACGSSLASGTHHDLLALQAEMMRDVMIGPVTGTMHADQLMLIARQARDAGATHLGIVEHDMRFPPDAFRRLLAHKKLIVGANYRQRQQNQWTAIAHDDTYLSSRGATGMETVLSVGMGVMLIDIVVFDHLHDPWWTSPYMTDHGRHMGVDVYFCRNAHNVGLAAWVDHDLSQHVGHIAGDIELWCDRLVYTQTGVTLPCDWR
jgi:hypothetical protein